MGLRCYPRVLTGLILLRLYDNRSSFGDFAAVIGAARLVGAKAGDACEAGSLQLLPALSLGPHPDRAGAAARHPSMYHPADTEDG